MDPPPQAPTVACDVCQRPHHPQRLPFYCAMDARNALYEGRIKNATALMETAELEEKINALFLGSDPDTATNASNRRSRAYVENCLSADRVAREETEQIIAAAEDLRHMVDAAKKEIEERKARIARRKAALASASRGIVARRNREMEEAKKAIKMVKYSWDRENEAMTHYRAALCTEVAKLYRLQRAKRANPVRFEYKIGGIEVVDLHHMNSAHPEHVSASLGHVAHLLWLASHYLDVRLPAEITLPHNDYPRPTIFSLNSSYHHGQVPFPGSSQTAPDPLDRTYGHIPHPRPLFLDKPLSTLAKEDPTNYTAFLEGVCLLSYNVVWLCRTQGIAVGDNSNSFEDFSYLGRNLWSLLIGSSLQRAQPGQPLIPDANTSSARNGSSAGVGDDDLSKATPRMGQWSHGAAHTNLGSAVGLDFIRSFRLPNPIKLADKLKARLVNEAPAPEWELIEDDEFGPNDLDDGVLVGGTPQSKARGPPRFGLESYMSVATVKGGGPSGDSSRVPSGATTPGKDREKNVNGWTKIKPR